MATKIHSSLLPPIWQLLGKFHRNILTNEGERDNFLGMTLAKSKFSNINFLENVAKFKCFANLLCGLVVFDVFYHYYYVWMETVLHI